MRLEKMTCRNVRNAIDVYLEYAWGGAPPAPVAKLVEGLCSCHELDVLFELFESECSETLGDGSGSAGHRRYAVRLGNTYYPFTKLVIQEYLVRGEFFFSVDTHDNLGIGEENPDYAEWQQVKRRNQELKVVIEAAWERAGTPTHASLQAIMEQLAQEERGGAVRARLLLVDDETHVAFGLKALLMAKGFDVDVAHNGVEALERLGRKPDLDLLMLDNDMPKLDGTAVLAELRSRPEMADLPVLMTSAGSLTGESLGPNSAFLKKPYPRQVLFKMIDQLLERD